ncbi:MAG TPA: GntR family transcriptional regulator [Dongiaceae bacterium]
MSLEVLVGSALAVDPVMRTAEPRKTDAAYLYNRLRNDILSLALGPGTPLEEEDLARSFRVSRSRVRDALVRLANDGHVVILPNRSIIVAPLDSQAIPRFMDALELMQRTTHRMAAVLRTEEDLARIRRCDENFKAATERGDIAAMVAANYELHVAIADAGHNAYFTSFYARLLGEAKRLLHMHYALESEQTPEGRNARIAEHASLIDAIAKGDPDLAEQCARTHSLMFRDHFARFFDQTYIQEIDVRVMSQKQKAPRRRRQKAAPAPA